MLKIGITGGIGSGKSVVCKIFSQMGIPVYDADSAAKKLMISDKELISNLKQEFGNNIYNAEGELDKGLFADLIFNDQDAMKKANNLIHPAVSADFEKWIQEQDGVPYAIEEAAILFESGADKNMDYVILVSAPENIRFNRVMLRDNKSAEYIKGIEKNQMSEELKKQKADFIIINDNEQLIIPQIIQLHNKLLLLAANNK